MTYTIQLELTAEESSTLLSALHVAGLMRAWRDDARSGRLTKANDDFRNSYLHGNLDNVATDKLSDIIGAVNEALCDGDDEDEDLDWMIDAFPDGYVSDGVMVRRGADGRVEFFHE